MKLINKFSHIQVRVGIFEDQLNEEIFTEEMSAVYGNMLMRTSSNLVNPIMVPIERCIRTTIPYEIR